MPNLIRRKQVDAAEFSGFFVEVGDENYYPVDTNPSGYVNQSTLDSSTGVINTTITNLSNSLTAAILSTGQNANIYTNNVSGDISTRLNSSGSSLTSSINSLSGYVISSTGTLDSKLNTTSGVLNTKINTLSGYSTNYTNSASGVLDAKITAASNATTINNIVSGNNFSFTGTKTFTSPTTFQRVNISGASTPTSIRLVASSGSVSIVGSGGTFVSFLETGITNSLWSVADSAGLPNLELFDDNTLALGRSTLKAIIVSGVSSYIVMPNLPTSSAGLPANTVYRDGNTLKIV